MKYIASLLALCLSLTHAYAQPTLANSDDIIAAKARANHTGTQAESTITGLVTDLAAKVTSGSIAWPGTVYANPTTGTFSSGALTFTPVLASQVAFSVFGNFTGSSATPTFSPSPTFAGTNLTGTGANFTAGATNAIKSATTTVSVSGATAPTNGQVLTATSTTAATWQTPSSGSTPSWSSITSKPTTISGFGITDSTAPFYYSSTDAGMLTSSGDCSTAFQAGVNAAHSTNHKTFYIQAGIYHFASTITIPDDVKVVGEGIGDRGGYVPWTSHSPFKTKLIYDGTANALNIPLTSACEIRNLELMASNTSTTIGTVGAGIFAANLDGTGATSWESYPYFTGNHLFIENCYVHEFNENLVISFVSCWEVKKCNFSSARAFNISGGIFTGAGAPIGCADGRLTDCFIGGGSYAGGDGIRAQDGSIQISDSWIYNVNHAATFYRMKIMWSNLNFETINASDYAVKLYDTCNFTVMGGHSAMTPAFVTADTPVFDLTGGTAASSVILLNISGNIGPVKTYDTGKVFVCPPISNQYEKIYSGSTLISTTPLCANGSIVQKGVIKPDTVRVLSGNYNAPSVAIGADNTGFYGNSASTTLAINSAPAWNFGLNNLSSSTGNGIIACAELDAQTGYYNGGLLRVEGSSYPSIRLAHTGAGTDEKRWDTFWQGSSMVHRVVSDNTATAATYMTVNRAGVTCTSVDFNAPLLSNTGDIVTTTAGKTLKVKSGTNALAGTVTLSSGAGTITSTAIDTNTVICLTLKTSGGTPSIYEPNKQVVSGSATVTGASTDTSTYNWVAFKVN